MASHGLIIQYTHTQTVHSNVAEIYQIFIWLIICVYSFDYSIVQLGFDHISASGLLFSSIFWTSIIRYFNRVLWNPR